MTVPFFVADLFAFSGSGLGTSGDPYIITTCTELQEMENDLNAHYKLGNDVDCSASSGWNSGSGFDPVGTFAETFDGDGYAISSLTISRGSSSDVGLFAAISGSSAVVKNVELTNVSITGDDRVGALVGFASNNATISNVSVSGTVSSSSGIDIGGVVGYGSGISVTRAVSSATISGSANLGGIAGKFNESDLDKSYNTGSVTASSGPVGGLIGVGTPTIGTAATVSNSFNAGAVSGSTLEGGVIGSLGSGGTTRTNVAWDVSRSGQSNCYASASVNCTAINSGGTQPDYFYDDANAPLSSWDFVTNWVERVSNYPLLKIFEDTTPPALSNVVTTPADTTIAVTWDTDEASSTRLGYGFNSSTHYTTETDTSQRVTSHSDTITGLLSCTSYDIELLSKDAADNQGSTSRTVTTTGCEGTSDGYFKSPAVPNGSPYAVSMVKLAESAEITPPASYSGTCDAVFQFQDLIENTVIPATGSAPNANNPTMAYALSAYCDPSTRLTSFDQPLSIKMQYSDSMISGIDESTLQIYRWSGTSWDALTGCTVDGGANTVTCTTTQFSTFGVFGSVIASQTSSGSAPVNHVVEMCDPQTGDCINVMPYGNGAAYTAYQDCVRAGQFSGYECSEAWARGEGYVARGELLDEDEVGSRKKAVGEEVIYSEQEKRKEEVPMLSSAEECEYHQYQRYPELRGQGVEEGLFSDADPRDPTYPALIDLAEQQIVSGDGDTGAARLDDPITRGEVAKLFTIAREDEAITSDCRGMVMFSDVRHTHWAYPFVDNMFKKSIVSGYGDGTFGPGLTIKKVELEKIAAIAFDSITQAQAGSISQRTGAPWYEPYEHTLHDQGVLPPWFSDLPPEAAMSRGDAFALLSNILQEKDAEK